MLTAPLTPSSGRSVCRYYTVRGYASTAHDRWMISSICCYHSRDLDRSRPILLLLLAGWSLPAGLQRCCCRVNVTLFSRVTLIRKLQSTSDLDHFHARELPSSRVKSRDDPISGRRGDSGVPYSFIYRDFAPVVLFTLQQHCNMLAVGFWTTR